MTLQSLVARVALAEHAENLDGLGELLRCDQAVRQDAVRLQFEWLDLKCQVGIGERLLIFHRALPYARPLQQQFIVKRVVVSQHACG